MLVDRPARSRGHRGRGGHHLACPRPGLHRVQVEEPRPVSRRSVAEALVTVTVALATKESGAPS